jgi:hypothetical protein
MKRVLLMLFNVVIVAFYSIAQSASFLGVEWDWSWTANSVLLEKKDSIANNGKQNAREIHCIEQFKETNIKGDVYYDFSDNGKMEYVFFFSKRLYDTDAQQLYDNLSTILTAKYGEPQVISSQRRGSVPLTMDENGPTLSKVYNWNIKKWSSGNVYLAWDDKDKSKFLNDVFVQFVN